MKKEYFIVKYTINDSGFEYGELVVVSGKNLREAIKKTKKEIEAAFDNTEQSKFEGDTFCWDDKAIHLDTVEEIPARDYNVLKKYVWSMN